MNLIITCEHAGNQVPDCYSHLFANLKEVLESHRGWDPGALEIAKFLATEFNVPLFTCETTRLLIEPNRSLNNHQLYSEYSQILFETDHDLILQQYYLPHRSSVEQLVLKLSKPVLHLSVHTFTPIFNGVVRGVDVGLLFDPARKSESEFCDIFRQLLQDNLPALDIRMNEPYKGTDDGFTTYLRTKFDDDQYLGIELEVNQKYIGAAQWELIAIGLKEAVFELLSDRN